MMEITDQQDHSYTNGGFDQINPAEFTYKMGRKEIEEFVKLRISNDYLFSGRKYSSKWGWRAILKHMGLQLKMNHRQAAKKWDNMKKKYKLIKYPVKGAKVVSELWGLYPLMDDAMEGRLDGMAPVLQSLPHNTKDSDFLPGPEAKRRKILNLEVCPSPVADLVASEPEIEVSLNGIEDVDDFEDVEDDEEGVTVMERCEEIKDVLPKVVAAKNSEQKMIQREQLLLQKEKATLEREIANLNQERTLLERERAGMERERVTMERERAVMERERAVMEREKSIIEKDREGLQRERLALDKEKARWERFSAQNKKNEKTSEDDGEVTDSDAANRKERFLFLFEKLIENI